MGGKQYILQDIKNGKRHPPMKRREAAELVGCSGHTLGKSSRNGYVLRGRWLVTTMEGESVTASSERFCEEFKEMFQAEWDRVRKKLLGKERMGSHGESCNAPGVGAAKRKG